MCDYKDQIAISDFDARKSSPVFLYTPPARYSVSEGDIVQINEVELWDSEWARLIARTSIVQVPSSHGNCKFNTNFLD